MIQLKKNAAQGILLTGDITTTTTVPASGASPKENEKRDLQQWRGYVQTLKENTTAPLHIW